MRELKDSKKNRYISTTSLCMLLSRLVHVLGIFVSDSRTKAIALYVLLSRYPKMMAVNATLCFNSAFCLFLSFSLCRFDSLAPKDLEKNPNWYNDEVKKQGKQPTTLTIMLGMQTEYA